MHRRDWLLAGVASAASVVSAAFAPPAMAAPFDRSRNHFDAERGHIRGERAEIEFLACDRKLNNAR